MTVDPDTSAVYACQAGDYLRNRNAADGDRAESFADRVRGEGGGALLDAGCGPGLYLPSLGPDAVALDAVGPMLDLVDHPRRLQADLCRLPLRPGSLGGAWARNSYLHIARNDLPLALAELHRACRVGAPIAASFLATDTDRDFVADDDLPGRRFWSYTDETLGDLFAGAGFNDVACTGTQPRFVDAVRARTLPDTVGPDMAILVCGLNPSLHAADAGVGFVSPSNRFWPAAIAAGLASRPRDPWHALRAHRTGMTDLVKRATRRADELTADEYRAGLARVERLCTRLRPRVVCLVGLSGWRAAVDRRATAGVQPETLGGRPVYVMPSTSGLNAHSRLADLADHLGAALDAGRRATDASP